MKNGKTPKTFKVGAVYDDAWDLGHYVIIKLDRKFITGKFLYKNEQYFTVLRKHCEDDEFIRFLSDLEMELL